MTNKDFFVSDLTACTRSDNENFHKEYMPVAEFSAKKNIAEEKIIEMIKDGVYSGRIKSGLWFIRREELIKKTVEKSLPGSAPTNIFLKLLGGHYGLAFTFWVWGVCGGFVLANILLIPVAEGGIEILIVPFIVTWFAYITMVFVGIWRSDKSLGVSSVISKIFVVIAFFSIGFILLFIIAMLTATYPNH